MPYRPPFDPDQVLRDTEAEYDARHRFDEQLDYAEAHDPSSWTSTPICGTCGRPLLHRSVCAACGDEELAA